MRAEHIQRSRAGSCSAALPAWAAGKLAPISRPAYRHEGGPARGRHAPSTRHRPFDKLRTLQVGAVAAKAADERHAPYWQRPDG
jgi:hypothetical protein